jgi:hypothetical protein
LLNIDRTVENFKLALEKMHWKINTNILNDDQKKFYQKNGYLVPSLS